VLNVSGPGGVGMEAWLEAITAGQQPPRALRGTELEQALRDVLLHWYEDGSLAASPLAALAAPRIDEPSLTGANALRRAIQDALAAAREGAGEQQALALHAVELAYLQRGPSHEAIAERLSVSRATLFRMLNRGIRSLAEAWSAR